MGVLTLNERRRLTRENCRILRAHILWKRRKENAAETDLILQIKTEEEKKRREEEERRIQEKEKRIQKLEGLKIDLKEVQEKKFASEEKLKLLQEKKHELFVKLKNTLMAKETERREKHYKEMGDFYSNVSEFDQKHSPFPQFNNSHRMIEQPMSFPGFSSQDAPGGYKYPQRYPGAAQDQSWQWTQSPTQQHYQQGSAVRPPNFRPPLQGMAQGQFTFNRARSPKFQQIFK